MRRLNLQATAAQTATQSPRVPYTVLALLRTPHPQTAKPLLPTQVTTCIPSMPWDSLWLYDATCLDKGSGHYSSLGVGDPCIRAGLEVEALLAVPGKY